MEAVLWYVLTGTRGGPNRLRILDALDDQPRNANRLAEDIDLDYKTVRHHLDVLVENGVLQTSGDEYGAVYLPTRALLLPDRSDAVGLVRHRGPGHRLARAHAPPRP